MFTLNVNGKTITVAQDRKLIDVLRGDLKLTSVKDGCDQGACGACTILVDGAPIKACVQKVSKFEGKEILTVEGLSDREREVYVYAFGEAGAVQCGFCIPGMVLCGKSLIDRNPNPTRDEIAFAIRNNICRCTGYKKIIDAIELAARLIREDRRDLKPSAVTGVGQRAHRVDVAEKVLGYGQYAGTTSRSTECWWAPPCAPSIPGRGCSLSTPARPGRCPASTPSSPRRTSPAPLRWAI